MTIRNIIGKKMSLYLVFFGVGKKYIIENLLKLFFLENVFIYKDVLIDRLMDY